MNCGDNDQSPPYPSVYQGSVYHGPYTSSIASSASSSSASVWSDAASQSSDDSSVHSGASDSELSESYTTYKTTSNNATAPTASWAQDNTANVERRSHPRRTTGATRTGPPSLVRQCDRKVNFVDGLVDSSAQIVEAIWPLSSVVCRAELGAKGVLPLRTFIQETLRRSRTSYSTLQVALYYLILIKSHVPQRDFTMEQSEDDHCVRALQCGRRMFLAALILASKYLQDRNYSARAWSKICGLSTVEINQNETAFLLAVNWKLHITETVFQKWSDIMLRFTSNKPGGPGAIRSCSDTATWKAIVLQLTPELDNIDTILASPSLQPRPCSPTLCSTPAVAPYMLGRYIVEDNDAARALQELSNNPRSNGCSPVNRAGSKRTRPASIDLQGNVRDLLNRKRACCSTEFAAEFHQPTLLARPGIWANILN